MADKTRDPSLKKWQALVFPALLTALSVFISLHLSKDAARLAQEEQLSQFREIAIQTTSLLQEKVNRFPQLLKSTRGMVINTDFQLDNAHWNSFFDSLNLDYDDLGIIGITFTQYVAQSDKPRFLATNQELYGNDFGIFPSSSIDEHYVIMQAVPRQVISRVRGYDIATERNRANAARYAKNSSQLTTTGPISLLPTAASSLDYLMLAPVYLSKHQPGSNLFVDSELGFAGWVTIGFSLSQLVEQTLTQQKEPLRISVNDTRSQSNTDYDSEQQPKNDNQQHYSAEHILLLSDERIQLTISPAANSPRLEQEKTYDGDILIIGLLSGLLASILLHQLLNTRVRALQLASNMASRSQEHSNRYQALFDQSPEAIIIHVQQVTTLCNHSALQLLGATSQDDLIGKNVFDFVHPDSKAQVLQRLEHLSGQQTLIPVEQRLLRVDGSDFLAEVNSSSITYEGQPAVQVMFRDISALKRQRNESQISRRVLEHTSEAIMVTDTQGEIIMTNPAFTKLTGYTRADTQGSTPALLASGHHDKQFFADLWELLLSSGQWRGELVNRKKEGQIYIQKTNISAVYDKNSNISHFVCLMSDITEQKKALDSIRFQAMHDSLTQLPNRSNFEVRAEDALRQAERNNQLLAILFIDLDEFKPINDTYGHLVGDQLLKTLANRLSSNIKANDMVSRIGGDEFLVMSEAPHSAADIKALAQRLLTVISEPVVINNTSLRVSASIGIAYFPRHGASIAKLINQADKAMYQAKEQGKGKICDGTPLKQSDTEPLTRE